MKPQYLAVPLGAVLLLLVIGVVLGPMWVTDTTVPWRVQVSGFARSVAGFGDWLEDVKKLRSDREQLVAERNKLLAEVADLQAEKRENEAIKKQFNIDTTNTKNIIMTHTAGLQQQGSNTYLLIDKGSADGLKKDQVVLSNGVLVGKISQVGQHSANVQLLTSLGTTVPVVIRHGQNVTKGVVEGSFNLTAKLSQVLPTDQLNAGDTIETSADGGLYPAGIVVGKVGAITKKDNQAFQTASVSLLWDPAKLELVFVSK